MHRSATHAPSGFNHASVAGSVMVRHMRTSIRSWPFSVGPLWVGIVVSASAKLSRTFVNRSG
jgi:hypothetical protein